MTRIRASLARALFRLAAALHPGGRPTMIYARDERGWFFASFRNSETAVEALRKTLEGLDG